MSGEQNCVVNDAIENIQRIIDAQNAKAGLKNYIYNPEVDVILGLNISELRNMSADRCGEYSFVLAQMATYIQLEINKVRAINKWCDDSTNKLLSKEYGNYGDKFTPYEVKKNMFYNQNDIGKKIYELKKINQAKEEAWFNVTGSIKFMSETLIELQRSKRKL